MSIIIINITALTIMIITYIQETFIHTYIKF